MTAMMQRRTQLNFKKNSSMTSCERILRDLQDRGKGNLTHSQAKDAEQFIRNYQHLFASSNFDLGRTAVFKHKINTGTV